MGAEEVYEAVLTIPYGKLLVPSHMILVQQRYVDRTIKKYEARLVAGRHRQTSSPTARPASIKILFAISVFRTHDVK